jgi:ribosomal protein L10
MNINISNVFLVLLEKKLSIICITLIFSFTSVIYALMQENIFQASGLYKESVNADAQPGFNSGLSNVDDIAKVATLPSLDEIRGKIVGLINAPASKLVRLLQRPDQDIISILQNKKD